MPLSPALSGLLSAALTFALGGAMNLVAIRLGWAARFDWTAAIAVPATVGAFAWGAWWLPVHRPIESSARRAPATVGSGRKAGLSLKYLLAAVIAPAISGVVFSEVLARGDRGASMWLLGAMIGAVSMAMAATWSRRRRSRVPSERDATTRRGTR